MRKAGILLLVILLPLFAFAQTGKIEGVVTDPEGNPLVGANVIVEGTRFGGATDLQGKYTIVAEPGSYTVKAMYIGYKDGIQTGISVAEGQITRLNLSLELKVISGEEVVVIGYGVQQKKDLTGAASTIRIDDVQKISTTAVSSAIQGRVAGVNVSAKTGAPGAGASIKIRGAGTLGNTHPLVIVDGVPSSMGSVNPEDIASIDILKDASAAAIYGSRAGNGVIIISTKRGDEGPVSVRFSSSMSMQSLAKKFPLVTSSSDYLNIVKMAADNAGIDYPAFVSMYEQNPGQFSSGTDWQDEYFRDALLQKYNLSIAGGSKNMNYSVSGHYAHQDGIVVTTYDKRMGLRVNADMTKGRIKIGESLSINRVQGKGRYDEGYSFFSLAGLSPLLNVHDASNPTGWSGQKRSWGFYREIDNIIGNMNLRDNQWDNMHLLASAYLEYRPMKNMVYTARMSQNIYNNYYYDFNPAFMLSELDLNDVTNMSETRSRSYHTVMDHTLNYNIEVKKHKIDVMAGYSQEVRKFRSTGGYVEKFTDDNLRVLNAGSEGDNAYGYEDEWHYRSYFGRINYSFADKYLFQANIRRDGSSRFAENNRWGNFPSVSAAWRISNEKFFNLPYVNDLKLRASYGELGMQEFDNYMFYSLIAFDGARDLNYPFGPGKEQAIGVGGRATEFPSVGLKWEASKQTNIGFDVALLENKMTMEFDYYIKKNMDVLYNPPIPYSTGSSSFPYINAANIDNRGIEVAFNYREMVKPLKYEISLTAMTNSNEVTRLGRLGTETIESGYVYWAFDYTTLSQVGHPLAPFYLYQTDGIFKSQAEVDEYLANGGAYFADITPGAGDVKYVDTNNDGVINADDKIYFGTAQPKAEFGLNLNMSYKRFDFNMFLHAVTGKQMINGAKWLSYWTNHDPGNYHSDLIDAWSPENSNSDIPRVIQNDDRNAQASDMWLEDADYLRLRHIEVGYTLPAPLVYGYGIQSMRIYIAGENLLTLTGYTGYDPATDYNDLLARGVDRSPYPLARQIITGIQIGL